MLASIDQAAHKLSHLLYKHHSKVSDKSHKARRKFTRAGAEADADTGAESLFAESSGSLWSEDELIGMDHLYQDVEKVSSYPYCQEGTAVYP